MTGDAREKIVFLTGTQRAILGVVLSLISRGAVQADASYPVPYFNGYELSTDAVDGGRRWLDEDSGNSYFSAGPDRDADGDWLPVLDLGGRGVSPADADLSLFIDLAVSEREGVLRFSLDFLEESQAGDPGAVVEVVVELAVSPSEGVRIGLATDCQAATSIVTTAFDAPASGWFTLRTEVRGEGDGLRVELSLTDDSAEASVAHAFEPLRREGHPTTGIGPLVRARFCANSFSGLRLDNVQLLVAPKGLPKLPRFEKELISSAIGSLSPTGFEVIDRPVVEVADRLWEAARDRHWQTETLLRDDLGRLAFAEEGRALRLFDSALTREHPVRAYTDYLRHMLTRYVGATGSSVRAHLDEAIRFCMDNDCQKRHSDLDEAHRRMTLAESLLGRERFAEASEEFRRVWEYTQKTTNSVSVDVLDVWDAWDDAVVTIRDTGCDEYLLDAPGSVNRRSIEDSACGRALHALSTAREQLGRLGEGRKGRSSRLKTSLNQIRRALEAVGGGSSGDAKEQGRKRDRSRPLAEDG